MYLKWIVCDVKKDKIREFSVAQQKWDRSTVAEGFIAQFGGWNINNKTEACILSIWEHKNHQEKFMNDLHDQIFENNKQLETYNSIRVDHFYVESDLDSKTIVEMVKESRILIVSDYLSKKSIKYFDETLKIKNQYIISKNESNGSRQLFIKFSDDVIVNSEIINKLLPNIDEIEKTEKKQILLDDSWRVCS